MYGSDAAGVLLDSRHVYFRQPARKALRDFIASDDVFAACAAEDGEVATKMY